MAVSETHPLYTKTLPAIQDVRAAYEGERRVKELGFRYLKPTASQLLDGVVNTNDLGWKNYEAYRARARFPSYVREAVEAAIGVLHKKPPTIELPDGMAQLLEKATVTGESLEHLLRRINEEQLVAGRIGLLLDLPVTPDPNNPLPHIAIYTAENLRNWDDGAADEKVRMLSMVVLDETCLVRDGFSWTEKVRYRVLCLGDLDKNEDNEVYAQQLVDDGQEFDRTTAIEPVFRNNKLTKIPFVFINTKDIASDPDEPPLSGLASLCYAIYNSEADYRQNLHMQGQDTLVTIGLRHGSSNPVTHVDPTADSAPDAIRTGAGAHLDLDVNGDAKYIGVNSQGLSEQRQALASDHAAAQARAGQLMNNTSGANDESGEALRIRRAAQATTLTQIAITAAQGLEQLLKTAAEWMGLRPDAVKVIPNTDFEDAGEMLGQDLVQLMTARQLGAPLSLESIHELLVSKGMTSKTFKEEVAIVEKEIEEITPPPSSRQPEGQAPGSQSGTRQPSDEDTDTAVGGE